MGSQNNLHLLQLLIHSPDLGIPSKSLIVNPNTTLHNLKLSLFPSQITSKTLDSLYFSFNGKPLHDSSTLLHSQITSPFSTLTLRIRALGGGGDGGATGAESRDCYLNMYASKKPDKVDPNEARLSRWTNCALSFEPLKPPCVIDRLGNVFNKEPLVEALLGKKLPKEFGGHIKGLKDMIPIHLSPALDDSSKFQCPITGLELNGNYKFFALKSCGHVLSAKALKELKSSGNCLVCHAKFSELEDKIPINGTPEEVAVLREKMEAEIKEKKEKKKSLKVNGGVVDGVSNRLSGTKHGVEEKPKPADGKVLGKTDVGKGKLPNAGVDVKGEMNTVKAAKKFKATLVAPPNATKEVYASIFTSSRKSDFKETYSCRSLPLGRN